MACIVCLAGLLYITSQAPTQTVQSAKPHTPHPDEEKPGGYPEFNIFMLLTLTNVDDATGNGAEGTQVQSNPCPLQITVICF